MEKDIGLRRNTFSGSLKGREVENTLGYLVAEIQASTRCSGAFSVIKKIEKIVKKLKKLVDRENRLC